MIYAYLCSFAGNGSTCYPSIEIILAEIGMSKTRFYKHLQALIDTGIVSKEQKRDGNRWGQTVYKLNHTDNVQFPYIEYPHIEYPHIEEAQNETAQNKERNINSFNNNSLNINSLKEYTVHICRLLNEAKARSNSKGRLKPNNAIIQLINAQGVQLQEIAQYAGELADSGKEISWYCLEDYCMKRQKSK